MIILYARPTCPYCARVRPVLNELGIPFDERNIGEQEHLDALLLEGGKRQVPFIIDTSKGIKMYESLDIVNYLRTTYGTEVRQG